MDSGKTIKVFRASKDSTSGVMVTPTDAWIIGDQKNLINVNSSGIVMLGRSISFATTSENIRHAGFFVGLNDIARLFPSTLVTPQSAQVPYPPLGMVATVTKDLPFFLAMMAATTAAGALV